MKVKLICGYNHFILDQFSLNMSLEDSIKYLKRKYIGEYVCTNGMLHVYVTHKIGDKVKVQRGLFIVTCKIVEVNEENIHPYLVEGVFTAGRTSDEYILGYAE